MTTKFILENLITHRELWDHTQIIVPYLMRYTDKYGNKNAPPKSVIHSFALLPFVEWFEENVMENILCHSESHNVWSGLLNWLIF